MVSGKSGRLTYSSAGFVVDQSDALYSARLNHEARRFTPGIRRHQKRPCLCVMV